MRTPVHTILGIVISCLTMVGCSGMSDDEIPRQIENIERFLENNNLIYTLQNGVYRHIGNSDRENYFKSTMADRGDEVHYYLAAYRFDRSRVEPVFYSNKDFIIDELKAEYPHFSDVYWPRESFKRTVGKNMSKGLTRGLPGCREGDSVRLFMPADLAYGESFVGTVPENSSIEFVLWIEKVIKK